MYKPNIHLIYRAKLDRVTAMHLHRVLTTTSGSEKVYSWWEISSR